MQSNDALKVSECTSSVEILISLRRTSIFAQALQFFLAKNTFPNLADLRPKQFNWLRSSVFTVVHETFLRYTKNGVGIC
jgi:hypothetical protein